MFCVLTEVWMERCWQLLADFISEAKAQSIWHHDWMLQFNIRFSFVFKSFPASSRDKDGSVLFMGGTSVISTCYLLYSGEPHPTYFNYRGHLKLSFQTFYVHIHRLCNLSSSIRDFWNKWWLLKYIYGLYSHIS